MIKDIWKKLFSVLTSFLMVFSLLSVRLTPIYADGQPTTTKAAKIGTTEYATLDEALAAATTTDTVTLLSDVVITADKTYDLTGKTIETDTHKFDVQAGKLTVTGGTISSDVYPVTGTKEDLYNIIYVHAGASLEINGGTYTTKTAEIIHSFGTVLINSGTFTQNGTDCSRYDSKSLIKSESSTASLTFISGSITSDGNSSVIDAGLYGIACLDGSSVILGNASDHTGPSIKTQFGALGGNNKIGPATYTVYGGTYETTYKPFDSEKKFVAGNEKFASTIFAPYDGSVTISGGTFIGFHIISIPYTNTATTISISGGFFNSEDELFYIGDATGSEGTGTKSISISGGEYTANPAQIGDDYTTNPTEYLGDYSVYTSSVPGYNYEVGTDKVAKVGDNLYGTLQAAINAADSGSTVTLLKDVSSDAEIEIVKSVTLNGDGHTLTNTYSNYNRAIRLKCSDINVTIENLRISNTGNLDRGIQIDQNYTGITLTIDSVTIDPVKYYAVEVANFTSNETITIKNSTMTGSIIVDSHDNNSNYTIENCNFTAYNVLPAGTSNSCSAFTFGGKNNTMTVKNTTVDASSATTNTEGIVYYDYYEPEKINANSNSVIFDSDTITVSDTGRFYLNLSTVTGDNEKNKITIQGSTYVKANELIAQSTESSVVSIKEGYFTVDPTDYVDTSFVYASDKEDYTYMVSPIGTASIGEKQYSTLADAVADASDGDTILLRRDASGAGIGNFYDSTTKKSKSFTIDFGGYTYTCTGPAVGSKNYESQAFHLEKNADVTLKNGKVTSSTGSGVAMLVQNYCNLTLNDITLDGSNLKRDKTSTFYTLSNNNGNTSITGNTSIIARDGQYAFDVYYWPDNGYSSVSVDVDTTGVIKGKIEYDASTKPEDMHDNAVLTIENINFDGEFNVHDCNNNPNIVITGGKFMADPSDYTGNKCGNLLQDDPDGYKYIVSDDGVAQIGKKQFGTLAAAVAKAEDRDTIVLRRDASGAGIGNFYDSTTKKSKSFTIDFGGHTYTCTGPAVGSKNTESQAFHLEKNADVTLKNGTITSSTGSRVALLVQNYCNLTLNDITLDGSNLESTSTSTFYTLSNNNGNTSITGNTSIIARDGQYAFDVYYWPDNGYSSVSVDVDTTGVIKGKIEYDASTKPEDMHDNAVLTIENINFDGEFNVHDCNNNPNIVITGGVFTKDPSTYVKKGYRSVQGAWTISDKSYAYKVSEVVKEENKLVSISAMAYKDDTADTENNATASFDGSTITVSGKVKATDNKVVLTYKTTDGTTDTVTIPYEKDKFTQPDSITIGNTTYSINIENLTRLTSGVAVVVTKPQTSIDSTLKDDENKKQAAEAITNAISNSGTTTSTEGLAAAVTEKVADVVDGDSKANGIEVKDQDGKSSVLTASSQKTLDALTAAKKTVASDQKVVLVAQPYLDIKVKDIGLEEGNSGLVTSITLEIEPLYNVVAVVTATDNDGTPDINSSNSATVETAQKMTVTTPVTITVPLPEKLQIADVNNFYVKHTHTNTEDNSESVYYYKATVTTAINGTQRYATFTTTNSFSTFEFSSNSNSTTISFGDGDPNSYNAEGIGTEFPVVEKDGYIFNGWNLTADGIDSTKIYTNMSEEMLADLNGKSVTATANYTKISTLAVTAPTFDAVTEGYTRPDAKAITITSSGNTKTSIKSVTVDKTGAFTVTGTAAEIASKATDTSWTIQPKTGLSANTYTGTITVTYADNSKASAQVSFTVNAKPAEGGSGSGSQGGSGSGSQGGSVTQDSTAVAVYRMYNPNSGEHFYTESGSEKVKLVKAGWNYEGIGWYSPKTSNAPVYRLYNPNSGDHFYTVNAAEKDGLTKAGWNYEGIGWYSDENKTVAVYRQYNPNAVTGTHNYTSDASERDSLVKIGWRDENIGWYGVSAPEDTSTTVEMFRLYNPNTGEHFYTANETERFNLIKVGWNDEGTGWYAPKTSNTPLYRLYNPNSGDHFFTIDAAEKNNLVKIGWKYEGISCYSDDAKTVAVYRQYNPNVAIGTHNYTTSASERDGLVKRGWKDEGIGWYGVENS